MTPAELKELIRSYESARYLTYSSGICSLREVYRREKGNEEISTEGLISLKKALIIRFKRLSASNRSYSGLNCDASGTITNEIYQKLLTKLLRVDATLIKDWWSAEFMMTVYNMLKHNRSNAEGWHQIKAHIKSAPPEKIRELIEHLSNPLLLQSYNAHLLQHLCRRNWPLNRTETASFIMTALQQNGLAAAEAILKHGFTLSSEDAKEAQKILQGSIEQLQAKRIALTTSHLKKALDSFTKESLALEQEERHLYALLNRFRSCMEAPQVAAGGGGASGEGGASADEKAPFTRVPRMKIKNLHELLATYDKFYAGSDTKGLSALRKNLPQTGKVEDPLLPEEIKNLCTVLIQRYDRLVETGHDYSETIGNRKRVATHQVYQQLLDYLLTEAQEDPHLRTPAFLLAAYGMLKHRPEGAANMDSIQAWIKQFTGQDVQNFIHYLVRSPRHDAAVRQALLELVLQSHPAIKNDRVKASKLLLNAYQQSWSEGISTMKRYGLRLTAEDLHTAQAAIADRSQSLSTHVTSLAWGAESGGSTSSFSGPHIAKSSSRIITDTMRELETKFGIWGDNAL